MSQVNDDYCDCPHDSSDEPGIKLNDTSIFVCGPYHILTLIFNLQEPMHAHTADFIVGEPTLSTFQVAWLMTASRIVRTPLMNMLEDTTVS